MQLVQYYRISVDQALRICLVEHEKMAEKASLDSINTAIIMSAVSSQSAAHSRQNHANMRQFKFLLHANATNCKRGSVHQLFATQAELIMAGHNRVLTKFNKLQHL